MYARVTTLACPLDRSEDAIHHIQNEVLPRIEGQAGSQGGLWLMDRQTGKVVAISLWNDEGAMRISQGRVTQGTGGGAQQLGITTESVEGFEVIAQL